MRPKPTRFRRRMIRDIEGRAFSRKRHPLTKAKVNFTTSFGLPFRWRLAKMNHKKPHPARRRKYGRFSNIR